MRPTKMTVYELFERQRRYVVPLFQRPYVWTREGQWEPLWEDIVHMAEQVLERTKARPHFLGAVVLNQRPRFGRELDGSDIIDGQQRLTTLQLLLAAFRDVVQLTDERRLYDELVRLTENSGLADEREVFKVWPTNKDQAIFRAVVHAKSVAEFDQRFPRVQKGKKVQPLPSLAAAYAFFSSSIRDFAGLTAEGDRSRSGERLHAIFEAFRQLLQLVVIDLEAGDDAQVIFETLNARGVPLLPSDLIRNFVFLRASRQGQDPDALYERWWRPFDERPSETKDSVEPFWKKEEKQGRMKRPLLDLFFVHYLAYRWEREVSHTRLFEEFQGWWDQVAERDLSNELRDIRSYSDTFATFFTSDGETQLGRFQQRLRILDISTVYPLLLFFLVERRASLGETGLAQVIGDLESYLVRRMICGLTPKNYNRLFPTIQRQIRDASDLAAAFRARLLEGTSEVARWPDDKEFERAWVAIPAYDRLKPVERVRMVLEAIEHTQATAKQERIRLDDKLTVEHVLPQSWRETWTPPQPTENSGDDHETADERRDRLLHSFGNLTLLTQPLNSSVSNGTYDAKRPEIAMQSRLGLNAFFQTQLTWDEDVILQRGRTLFASATKMWPHPG